MKQLLRVRPDSQADSQAASQAASQDQHKCHVGYCCFFKFSQSDLIEDQDDAILCFAHM